MASLPSTQSVTFASASRGLSNLTLSSNEIHVWAATLDVSLNSVRRLERTLSAAERHRGSEFVFERDRLRWGVGRGLLRTLLGCYEGASASRSIAIEYGPAGKPYVPASNIHFNVAHSEKLVVLALTRASPLGVDIEHVRPMRDAKGIAERFFSPAEVEVFRNAPADEKLQAFFRCWTRQEAFLKATGSGLTIPLRSARDSVSDSHPGAEWSVYEMDPAQDYVGALVFPRRPLSVVAWWIDLDQIPDR